MRGASAAPAVRVRRHTISDMCHLESLTSKQRTLLAQWLPGLHVVRDHSWKLVDNAVLEVEALGARYIVKADGPSHHHTLRELDAHEAWLGPLTTIGRAPRLVAGDRDAKVLVTEYQSGDLVMGSPAQEEPDTFRQAGRLLAGLHAQAGRLDGEYEAAENAKALRNLGGRHRIPWRAARQLRSEISGWPDEPVHTVPTHGDWQPRNWLVHEGRISAIDFGRAALRPALTDWLRLAARDFQVDPRREQAFVEGYGADPRTDPAWYRERVREAVNTAVWAHGVGDEPFEAQGMAMIERVLATG